MPSSALLSSLLWQRDLSDTERAIFSSNCPSSHHLQALINSNPSPNLLHLSGRFVPQREMRWSRSTPTRRSAMAGIGVWNKVRMAELTLTATVTRETNSALHGSSCVISHQSTSLSSGCTWSQRRCPPISHEPALPGGTAVRCAPPTCHSPMGN